MSHFRSRLINHKCFTEIILKKLIMISIISCKKIYSKTMFNIICCVLVYHIQGLCLGCQMSEIRPVGKWRVRSYHFQHIHAQRYNMGKIFQTKPSF